MSEPIDSFRGEYRFLSNFYPSPVRLGSLVYPTVEHAYQAAKSVRRKYRRMIQALETPGEAKRVGKTFALRADWEEVKLDIMRLLVTRKFEIERLRERLVDTVTAELIEGNTWGDTIWGVCNGVGENHLGKILMDVRAVAQRAPTIHNSYKTPGWEDDPDCVYCGRPGKGKKGPFGNPFLRMQGEDPGATVPSYEPLLRGMLAIDPVLRKQVKGLLGKKLICFCARNPDVWAYHFPSPPRCHCQILAKVCVELNYG